MPKKNVNVPDADPDTYGSRGQKWHPSFVEYMVYIVTHPTYVNMPDAIVDDGKIQWEAPSNRKSGKYKDTHHARRGWWSAKAKSIGIDPNSDQWISRTAKAIHPTGEKPCKRCGVTMRLSYSYANRHMTRRLSNLFGENFKAHDGESLHAILERIVTEFGETAFLKLPSLLKSKGVKIPQLHSSLESWLNWIERDFIPAEPSVLSPGAMSNAPDRLDGFHSFNLCCRGKADTGRHSENMRSYTTDRRVFEYWSDGNWIAADRLMGVISSRYRDHKPADGGDGPSTADHIGPVSLGFMHRPEFRLLSRAANSAKNNRMTKSDVDHLKTTEDAGTPVVSWYAQSLWNARKNSVLNEETAVRLSKLMRDNQRIAMGVLLGLFESGDYAFLVSLLGLGYASKEIDFIDLYIDGDSVTRFARIEETPRTTKYTQEQQARRIRIAFDSLRLYATKNNRHNFSIEDTRFDKHISVAHEHFAQVNETLIEINKEFDLLLNAEKAPTEQDLRAISTRASLVDATQFKLALAELEKAMDIVAGKLSDDWESDRYVREIFDMNKD